MKRKPANLKTSSAKTRDNRLAKDASTRTRAAEMELMMEREKTLYRNLAPAKMELAIPNVENASVFAVSR